MRHRTGLSLLWLLLGAPAAALAVVPGGGPAKSDCYAEFGGVTATKGRTTVACVEGTACDRDGACNDSCDFGVQLCLNQSGVPGCSPPAGGLASLAGAAKLGRRSTPFAVSGAGLANAACVPFPGGTVVALTRNRKGKLLATTETIALRARAETGVKPAVDADRLKLVCLPSPTLCPIVSPTTTTSTSSSTTSTSTSTSASTSSSSSTSTSTVSTTSSSSTSRTTTSTTSTTSTTGPCVNNAGCTVPGETCCAGTCRNLQTDPHACGSCGTACQTNTGTVSNACSGGTCHPSCAAGWGSCDGVAPNGCEAQLDSVTNCTACGVPCTRANASATCGQFLCRTTVCNSGFANCDGVDPNGCETHLDSYANTPPGDFLGSFGADSVTSIGLSCPATACNTVASRSGVTSAYFHLTAADFTSGLCVGYLGVRVQLASPANGDYDLYVTGGDNCAGGCSSTLGPGQTDAVTVTRGDSIFSDDGFDVAIEVRYFGGASCTPWTLTVSTGGC